METNEIEPLLSASPEAQALFQRHGVRDFARNIDIANILRRSGMRREAGVFFGLALRINPNSKDALLAKLSTELEAGIESDGKEILRLKDLDLGFFSLLMAKQKLRAGAPPREVLEVLGNSFESFRTGSECDWIFLRAAKALEECYLSASGRLPVDVIPRRLFFYWDKHPPKEVLDNIEYHSSLSGFEVHLYDRDHAREFLREFYGFQTVELFSSLRHPSEESDFFRFHIINALGGYYLDTDEQITSIEALRTHILSQSDAVFLLSSSGPVHSAFFGAIRNSPVIEECIRILLYNCFCFPKLSMWLKAGPGPITRALSRTYHRSLFYGQAMPSFKLLDEAVFPIVCRAVDMSYRSDARDWRVFEQSEPAAA